MLNYSFLVFIGPQYGAPVILFLMCMVWVSFFSKSWLVMCHIYYIFYASIYTVFNSDIIWFIPGCIQLILVSCSFVLVLLLV